MQALTHTLLFLILFILVCIWQDQLLTDEDKKKINSNRTLKESWIIIFTYLFITVLITLIGWGIFYLIHNKLKNN
jgi:heme/copper-type cytochrome/quinol oxidase subunit 2